MSVAGLTGMGNNISLHHDNVHRSCWEFQVIYKSEAGPEFGFQIKSSLLSQGRAWNSLDGPDQQGQCFSAVVAERGKGSVRLFESSARLETQLGEEGQGFNETGAVSAERTSSAGNPKIRNSKP